MRIIHAVIILFLLSLFVFFVYEAPQHLVHLATPLKPAELGPQTLEHDCFLAIQQQGELHSLYELVNHSHMPRDLEKLTHQFHQLRLLCFTQKGEQYPHLIAMDHAGIMLVQYDLVNKHHLMATATLVDGTKAPLLLASKELVSRSRSA